MERLRIHLDQNVASLHQQAFLVILAQDVASYFETNLGVDVADRNSNPLRIVRYLILNRYCDVHFDRRGEIDSVRAGVIRDKND